MKYRIFTAAFSALLLSTGPSLGADTPSPLHIMLQGSSTSDMTTLVENAGGTITHDLHIINAVGAKLTQSQLEQVLESPLVARFIDDLTLPESIEEEAEDNEACKVRGHIELSLSPQVIHWTLYNKRPAPAFLENLEITWPLTLGPLETISIGGATVDPTWINELSPHSVEVHMPDSSRPSVTTTADLEIRFKNTNPEAAPRQSDFSIKASFTGGCSTELIPGYENNHADYYYNSVASVDALHLQGITGKGVTVAVIDSGLWEHEALVNNTAGTDRIIGKYDALTDTEGATVVDESGHGTHMTSIIAHSGPTYKNGQRTGTFKGVAPDANLVAVKVLDRDGRAHLLDIVRAIQWVVDNRQKYKIRILNLSFAQLPRWPYWEDPVNQAVMKAWQEGIAVVAAAGNEGPDPMTIGSPGNLPYVITVGAVTDSWTPQTRNDDYVPDFSSQGPTPSGHIKPDVVALGGHITGLIRPQSALSVEQPEDILKTGEFVSTGSSQASALVSGILAILLQLEPDLTPDDLKCKLISSAEPAINRDGLLAYSPFQQGYGYVNTIRAITLGGKGCGNPDWDIAADIAGEEHFYGPAIMDKDGNASLPGLKDAVSSTPSEKGLSETRKWGVKDHIERDDYPERSAGPATEQPFDWEELYLMEKTAIEQLSQDSPARSPANE